MSVFHGFINPALGPRQFLQTQPHTLWGLPFDALRAAHAASVRSGLIKRSMLESRDFEHAVVAMERAMLGPLARRV